MLRDAGYEILDWFYTPRANSVGAAATQRLLKLPRKLLFALHEDVAARVLGDY
ncbi:MAG: methylase, partial [Acidobacteria bacterium]